MQPSTRPSDLNPDEMTDLEELEQFAKTFKQRRIKLGKCASVPCFMHMSRQVRQTTPVCRPKPLIARKAAL